MHHVPEIPYHWRITPGSTAETVANNQGAVDAGVKAVADLNDFAVKDSSTDFF